MSTTIDIETFAKQAGDAYAAGLLAGFKLGQLHRRVIVVTKNRPRKQARNRERKQKVASEWSRMSDQEKRDQLDREMDEYWAADPRKQ